MLDGAPPDFALALLFDCRDAVGMLSRPPRLTFSDEASDQEIAMLAPKRFPSREALKALLDSPRANGNVWIAMDMLRAMRCFPARPPEAKSHA